MSRELNFAASVSACCGAYLLGDRSSRVEAASGRGWRRALAWIGAGVFLALAGAGSAQAQPTPGVEEFGTWTTDTIVVSSSQNPSASNVFGSGLTVSAAGVTASDEFDIRGTRAVPVADVATDNIVDITSSGAIDHIPASFSIASDDGSFFSLEEIQQIALSQGASSTWTVRGYQGLTETATSFSVSFSHNVLTSVDFTTRTGFDNISRVEFTQTTSTAVSNIRFDQVRTAAAAADTTPPVVQSIAPTGGPGAGDASVDFRVTFDENANNVSTGDFSLTTTGTANGSITAVSASSGTTIDVTVSSITGTGTLRVDLNASTDIVDDSGNGNGTNGSVAAFSSGTAHSVDRDAPTLAEVTPVTTPTADSTPSYTFSTTEAGTLAVGGSCGSSDEGAVASGNNAITLTQTDNSTALADGAYTDCTATVTDAAGNASSPLAITSFTVDTAAPVVQTIALQGSPAANAASVTYRVTFNENANLIDTGDFALTTTGGATGNIASVSSASGTTVDVVVDTLAGDGTIRLDLQGATNIDDDLDNTPPGAFTSGGVHTVNRAAPAVTAGNISISGASGTGGAFIIGDTVTATWNNTAGGDNNSDIASVTVDFSAFGGGAAVAASNSMDAWTATYTITAGAIDATNLNVSVTATDTGSNATTTADTTNATVDNQAPSVSDGNISISGASGAGGAFITGDTVTATWNNTGGGDANADTIAGVTVDFTEFGGGAAVAASNSSDTWTATHTITAGSATGPTRMCPSPPRTMPAIRRPPRIRPAPRWIPARPA